MIDREAPGAAMLTTDVLIVGAGPVGQMAALALASQGIECLLVDRRLERSTAPKAHAVNPRTLEICDGFGLGAETLRTVGAPASEAGWVRFGQTLTGPEFGHLPYERQQDDVCDLTPFPLSNLAQPDFEAALAKRLEQLPQVGLLRGCECVGVVEEGEQEGAREGGVVADLALRGTAGVVQVRSRYVLAADGAGSRLRSALGIELEGLENLQHHLMIHFEADLFAQMAARPGILHFQLTPDGASVLIAYDIARNWVLMHGWDPASEQREAYDDARCRALIEAAVGAPVPDARIRNLSPWSMCAQVATAYRAGRVFLVGDAAHRFPPTGGLGLNTGIVDAQNIAWKLAAVLRGEAGPALLDSYEAERRPIAQINTQQSLANSAKLFELIGALMGSEPARTAQRYAAICADPAAFPEVAAAVEVQRPHFDSLALQLGYRYASDAVIDGCPGDPAADISAYLPSWDAGACVPHRRVRVDGRACSLLSLLPADRFCLIAGPAGDAWADAAAALAVPVTVLRDGVDYVDIHSADSHSVDSHSVDSHSEDTHAWHARTGLPDDGALLVRPDRHIALRCIPSSGEGEGVDAAASRLAQALDHILARASTA